MTHRSPRPSAPRASRARAHPGAARAWHASPLTVIGAVYVWLGIIVLFSIWVPETFPNLATAKQILNGNAITALAALSIIDPAVGAGLRPVRSPAS